MKETKTLIDYPPIEAGASNATAPALFDANARRSMAGVFLLTLFNCYQQGYIEVRALRAGARPRQEWFWIPPLHGNGFSSSLPPRQALAQIVDYAVALSDKEWSVYVGVLPRGREGKAHKNDIYQAGFAYADLDFKSVPEPDARVAVNEAGMVVHSGNGLHAYFAVRPVVTLTEETRVRFEDSLARLQEQFGADHTADVTRILRVPGTWNWKDPQRPRPVVLERCAGK